MSALAAEVGTCCPLCQGESHHAFAIGGYAIHDCRSCEHRFAEMISAEDHVEQTYSDDYFFAGGAGYSNYLAEEHLLVKRGAWYARRLARYMRPGRVLDVGAAAGFTLQGFRQAGWKCRGVEPNPTMAEHARRHFKLAVETGSLESWDTTETFDLTLMLQVLPHFIDPRLALSKVADRLMTGNHLLIETPNRGSLAASILGRHWHEYSPPSVLHWFTLNGLAALASECGLELQASGHPSKWIEASHAKSLLRHKATHSAIYRIPSRVAGLIPDRAAIPYFFNDIVWALFRKR